VPSRDNTHPSLYIPTHNYRGSDFDRYVVTADHGEALGRYGVYEHREPRHPNIRRVPWFEVSAVEEDHSVVDYNDMDSDVGERTVEERLAELGYL